MKALVTGGAGFIGSHLSDALIKEGWEVHVVDRRPPQDRKNIEHLIEEPTVTYTDMDVTNAKDLDKIMNDVDMVFHLAANSDIQRGGKDPNVDFQQTFDTTRSVLESMRRHDVKKIFFASTSAVYGNKVGVALNETTGGLEPISYYGAYKLSSEALISAYSHMNDMNALIFRFPNVVGPRLTHGVIYDFIRKLKDDPRNLTILGDGKQRKQYIHVSDLVNGITMLSKDLSKNVNIYNISTESFTTVTEIADIVCERMGLTGVEYRFTGGSTGWVGDVPSFEYDIGKIISAGWVYEYDSTEAVRKTLHELTL